MSKSLAWTVWIVTATLLGLFFAWPLVITLRRAFFDANNDFTLAYIAEVFKNPIYLEGLRNSFLMGLATTCVSVLIALPLALLSDRLISRARRRSPPWCWCR